MPTLIETATLDKCAALCKELDLRFIELNMNLPQYQLDKIDIEYFKAVAEKYGIYYTIHLDENLNISDFNPYVAQAYRRTVRETIEVAKKLGVPILNMHLSKGVYFTLPDKKVFLFDEYKDQYLKSIEDFCEECEKSIGDNDIKICVENCNDFAYFQFDALDILLKSRVFGLTFDIGHAACCQEEMYDFYINKRDNLIHMHFHDAINKSNMWNNHLALGDGELDLQKYLSLAKKQNCRVVLETKNIFGLRKSVDWINSYC